MMSTETNTQYGPVFKFINYKVYQQSKQWFQEVVSLKGVLETNTELWHLLKSNCTSVLMNITAASTKLPQDAKRHLSYAITSANKAVACLDIACDSEAITAEEFETLSEGYKDVIIQIKGFIKAIGSPKKQLERSVEDAVPA